VQLQLHPVVWALLHLLLLLLLAGRCCWRCPAHGLLLRGWRRDWFAVVLL
jgi:hypothetical protein